MGKNILKLKHLVVTGRIGTGKTTYANQLVEQNQQKRILTFNLDYDILSHTIITQLYGIDGETERRVLAKQIFSDSAKRKELESVVHPQIFQLASRKVAEFVDQLVLENSMLWNIYTNEKIQVIHQIPLYHKTRDLFSKHFGEPDEIVTLTATDAQITERLLKSRTMSVEDIQFRLQSW